MGQPSHGLWEDDGTDPPGIHVQAQEGQEHDQGKLMVLCDNLSVSVDGERMVDLDYLDFRKAFDVIS